MTVNATLFVQVFNFLVAYFLIRFILLKPAVAVIEKEDRHLDGLSKNLEELENEVERLADKKEASIIKSHKKFKLSWPDLYFDHKPFAVDLPKVPEASEKDLDSLAAKISKGAYRKVLDV